MIRNDKLQVQIGESRFISGRYLHATDLDTSDDQILFIVKSLPTEGELILNQFGKDDKILRKDESFTEDQGKNDSTVWFTGQTIRSPARLIFLLPGRLR